MNQIIRRASDGFARVIHGYGLAEIVRRMINLADNDIRSIAKNLLSRGRRVDARAGAVIALVGEKLRHQWRERQDIGRRGNVGILARGQVKDDWPAERIAQPVDLGRAPTARAADGLILLPPFPPEAQR